MKSRGDEEEQSSPVLEHSLIRQLQVSETGLADIPLE